MKYTIHGLSQKEAVNNHLDQNDLLILRFIIDFYPNMTKKIINNKEYGWISYEYVLKELPILNIKKRTFREKIRILTEKGFLEKECLKNKKGTFSYIRIAEKIIVLTSETDKKLAEAEICQRVGRNLPTGRQKSADQNNSSIKDYSIKDSKEKILNLDFVKNEDWKNLVKEWLDYKKREFNFSYKTEKTVEVFYQKLLSLSNQDLILAKEIIGNSIASRYQGIFPLKNNFNKEDLMKKNDNVFRKFYNNNKD